MKYAIVKSKGRQHKLEEGKSYIFDRMDVKEGEEITFEDVLFAKNGDEIKIGTPTIKGMVIKGLAEKHLKGEKIRVSRYSAKVRHRRSIGFRPYQTKVMIKKINI